MIGSRKAILLFLFTIVFMPLLCGQTFKAVPSLTRGVNLIVGPLDQFSRTLGVDDEKIHAAARASLEASGLTINESSEILFTVSVQSLPQREEDKYPFRIEMHAGTAYDIAIGHEEEPWVIGNIPEVAVVDIPWHSQDTLITRTSQLARLLSVKLRNKILDRGFIEIKEPHEVPVIDRYSPDPGFPPDNHRRGE